MKQILSLDLSIKCTGYAIFEQDGVLTGYGTIKPITYPGYSTERYPKRTIIFAKSVARQIVDLIANWDDGIDIEHILIEEANLKGIGGMLSQKSIAGLHFFVMSELLEAGYIEQVEFITTSEWRKSLNIKKNGDWKRSSVEYVNNEYSLDLENKDHDAADAICLGSSFFTRS